MDDCAKRAVIHKVAHLVIIVQALDIVHIEHQRAVDVLVDSAGRQVLAVLVKRVTGITRLEVEALVGHLDAYGRRSLDLGIQLDELDGEPIDFLQLGDVTRGLTGTHALGAGVIDERYLGRPIEQPIEIKGHDRFLLLDGGHAVGTTDVVGDKRVDATTTGEHALVHRQNHHTLEVQAAGL